MATGIYFPEGLAWSDVSQSLFVSGVQQGTVTQVWPEQGRQALVADLAGGANNAAAADDGGVLVTQNGGLDAYPGIARSFPEVQEWPAIRSAEPGLVHVSPDGTWRYVLRDLLDTPNDLVVGVDGTVYLTDPGNPFRGEPRDPRVRAWAPDGSVRTIAGGFEYCNGIDLLPDGALVVTDHGGVLRVDLDGSTRWLARGLGDPGPDGVAVDQQGNVYVATARGSGVQVLDPAGTEVEFLPLPEPGSVSNCCFGSPGRRWLFATDTRRGQVVCFQDLSVPGRVPSAWPVAPTRDGPVVVADAGQSADRSTT